MIFAVRVLLTLCVAGALIFPPSVAVAQEQPTLSGERVTLNFVNADLEAVVRAIGAYTNRQFLIDPRVKGTINLVSDKPLNRSQVLGQLYASLRLQGFAAVETDGVIRIVPEADAKLQGGIVSERGSGGGDQIVTQVFRLQHESAQNLVPVLRPLIAPNNTINAYPANNTLVVTDYAENLRRIARIIAAVDSPNMTETEIVPIKYGVAVDLGLTLQRLLEPGQGGDPSQRVTALAETRTNSLIVRAASPARMRQVKALIAQLDQPTKGQGNLNVIALKNAEATKLVQVLQGLFSGSGSAGGGASPAPLSPATPVATPQGAPGGALTLPQSGGGAAPVTVTGPGGSVIMADPATNSLIIRAPEPVYAELRTIIERLDIRRAQIMIEALIVEISADKAAELGIQWAGLTGNSDSKYRLGVASVFGSASLSLAGLAAGGDAANQAAANARGLNLAALVNNNIGAIATALESDGNANVLSVPSIVVLDNDEAEFIVGENVPFVTGSFTNTGAGGGAAVNPFQTIERKDVGLTLKVRPRVSEGGVVQMPIALESSAVKPTPTSGARDLVTTKRAFKTSVNVDDGQIVILGGLISDNVRDTNERVPILGDIPFLGNLFKYQTRNRGKTNLMVFLKPTVMRDANSLRSVVIDRYDSIRGQQQQAAPPKSWILPDMGSPQLPFAPAVPSGPVDIQPGGTIDLRRPPPANGQVPQPGSTAPTAPAAPAAPAPEPPAAEPPKTQ
ncbi:MAG: type II secretion system secretin GspD [Burkholderiaceae bacterium]